MKWPSFMRTFVRGRYGRIVAVAGIVGGTILLVSLVRYDASPSSEETPAQEVRAQSQQEQAPQTSEAGSDDDGQDSGNTQANNTTESKSVQGSTTEPPTLACKQFTPQLAQQILGDGTSLDTGASVMVSKTTDAHVSRCVYANGNAAAGLTARIAQTKLGESTNAIAFGSGRPADVQTVHGYGQAAYWDDDEKTLHVLKRNNHYSISRSSGTQLDTKALASVLVPEL